MDHLAEVCRGFADLRDEVQVLRQKPELSRRPEADIEHYEQCSENSLRYILTIAKDLSEGV